MDVRKAMRYHAPYYPDKETSFRSPALLRSTPERWRHNASACAALAATSAILLSACAAPVGKGGRTPAPKAVSMPFFEHGDGRGSFGCVSVAPPAFLSESEAYTVIHEEAEKAGISFEQGGMTLDHIRIPETSTDPENNKDGIVGFKTGALELDGYDRADKIAFEFVSTEDVEAWCAEHSNATVTTYPFIEAAKALNQSVNDAHPGEPVAVFYDPHYRYEDTKQIIEKNQNDFTAMEQELREHVKEDLRAQVRDFIAWLKAEGIV